MNSTRPPGARPDDRDDDFLAQAVDLATDSARGVGGPFGALIATPDGAVFTGTNRVTATHDPTAHAEVTAIRTACATRGHFDLAGAVLYSSCEPCPMCLAAALWARIERVVFAADRHDAASAGFDDAAFHSFFEAPQHRTIMSVQHRPTRQATEPFEAWQANERRIAY